MINALVADRVLTKAFVAKEPKAFLPIPVTASIWNLIRKRALYVTLCLTDKCNMACNLCFMCDNQGRSYVQEFRREDILLVVKNIGTKKKVLLSGGEPTLREDLLDIIDIIKKSDNIPVLYTNGIRLADFDYVKSLADHGLEKIYLSLDGLNENTTSVICGDRSYLAFKLKALDNLKKVGSIKVWLTPRIAYGVNEHEIGSLLDLAVCDDSRTIKGIMFIAATRNGLSKYHLPADTATTADYLLEHIEINTGGVLNTRYFREFNRLRENLNCYLGKFHASMPLSYNRVLARIKNGRIEQFIPLDDLKEINYLIENRKITSLAKYAYKYRAWLSLVKYVYAPTLMEFDVKERDDIIFIGVTYITDEPLPTLEKRGLMNLVKGVSSFHLYAQGPT